MPIGGESVGRAYVRILADGSGLDQSIRDQFDDAEPAIRGAGKKHGEAYTESWEKQMKSAPTRKVLREAITDAFTKGEFLEDLDKGLFHSNKWQTFRKSMAFRFGEAGKRAAANLERELGEGLSFEALGGRLRNVTAEVARATKEILDDKLELERAHTQALEIEYRRRDAIQEAEVNRYVANQNRVRTVFQNLSHDVERFTRGEKDTPSRKQFLDHISNLRQLMEHSGAATHEFGVAIDAMEERVRKSNPTLIRASNIIGDFADRSGRLTGRGSRNNFLNFFGGLTRGFVNILQVVPRTLDFISDFGQSIASNFSANTARNMNKIPAAITAVGASLVAGLPALIAFTAGIAALILVLGPFVALLGGLVGIVIALASSLSFALVGAIGAVVGALGPAVAAAAVLASAFIGLDKGAKKVLKNDFKPVRNGLRELARQARIPIFANLERQGRRFGQVVGGFGPLFRGVGKAISNVGDYFLKATHSVGFLQFQAAMTRFLPHAVESLGRSFGNFLGGMGGVFRSLIPLTQRFLRWLEKITGEFARWANEDGGQRRLKRFWTDTADSLHSVWGFLKSVGGLMGVLFEKSKKTGDTIFDDMARGIRKFTKYLEDNPKAVGRFFRDVHSLSKDIGTLIKDLAHLADALDTVGNRRAAMAIIQGIGTAAQLSVGPIVVLSGLIGGIPALFDKIKKTDFGKYFSDMGDALLEPIRSIGRDIGKLGGLIGRAFSGIGGSLSKGLSGSLRGFGSRAVGLILNPFSNVGAKIGQRLVSIGPAVGKRLQAVGPAASGAVRNLVKNFAGVVGKIAAKFAGIGGPIRTRLRAAVTAATGAVRDLVGKFSGIVGKIATKFAGVGSSVRGKLKQATTAATGAVRDLVGKFSGVVGKIAGKFSGVGSAIRGRLSDAVGAAGRVAGNIVDAFRGLAGRIVGAIGSIHLPTPSINWPSIPGWLKGHTAAGGIFEGARGIGVMRTIGEAGAEAVVPLNRPLSQVDPAVRMLSAFAQGKLDGMAKGGIAGAGKTINANNWTIVSPNTNTEAVAATVVNRLVPLGY